MPMFPSEETVRPILEPHQPRLAAIFDRAWARVSAMPERPNFDLKRTVAVMMHQFVMIELRAEYSAESGVHLIEVHETIRMLIDRKVVVRLKKMDERGYTRAATTPATLAFITPMAPLPFAGEDDFPDQCSVDVGYVLNDLGTRIDDILVAARNRDAILWSYAIARDAPSATELLPQAPVSPSSPATIIAVPDAGVERKKTGD